ncbi:MAG TPA: substrate-binding domain-containing protein, partial [Devosia sp.]|nr:substrate-binding domain-containing protein [Devosia sp.]
RVTLDDKPEDIRLAIMERIDEGGPPDGYVCPGDAVALGVIAGLVDSGLAPGIDADIVTKAMSGIFSLVRPKVDVISEDISLAGLQMGELLLKRLGGAPVDELQILQRPEIPF